MTTAAAPIALAATPPETSGPSRRVPFYPLAIALWLVLRMASANVADLRGPTDLLRPLAVSALAVAVSWAIAWALSPRDRHRRALLALLGVVWFAFLPAIGAAVEQSPLAMVAAPGMIAASACAMLPLAIAVMCVRRDLAPLSRFLDTSALVLLLLPLPGLAPLVAGDGGASGDAPPAAEWPLDTGLRDAATAAHSGRRPDVYLIVLDKYTGAASLKQNFGFDNTPFLAALRKRGFVVPTAARANYPMTHLALSSMLNWRLLEDSPRDADATAGMRQSYARVESSRAVEIFQALGYRFHFIPSPYAVTLRNRHAHATYDADPTRWSEFEIEWWGSTAMRYLYKPLCRGLGVGCSSGRRAESVQSPEAIERRLELLRGIADSTGPKFVFAHFLVPHEPYVFDASCGHLAQRVAPEQTSDFETGEVERQVKHAYVQQVQCVNRMMLALVDSLDGHSVIRPVILLQADHGHGRLYARMPLEDVPADRLAERMDIFAAYRFPNAQRMVHDSISPVNALPAMLEGTFGLPVPRQPDASFWAAWDSPFATTRLP